MAVAKRRAIDYFRRAQTAEAKYRLLGYETAAEESEETVFAALDEDYIADDLLRLMFVACHPVLSVEARVALTLRLLGGLSTTEIARAFLSPEPTIAQRIVRAKRSLAEAHVAFEVPDALQRMQRLTSVLEVIYLIFNEGYSASSGDDILRPGLSQEAVRLGRVLAELAPEVSEVHGLVALMELQSSRARARVGPSGEHVLLLEQDRGRWDQMLIRRGLAARARGAFVPTIRLLHAASGNRRVSRTSACGAGNRLGAHRRSLRCARGGASHCRRQAEPCRCRGHGFRTCKWARARRCAPR